jgi:microcystin-dependent protein
VPTSSYLHQTRPLDTLITQNDGHVWVYQPNSRSAYQNTHIKGQHFLPDIANPNFDGSQPVDPTNNPKTIPDPRIGWVDLGAMTGPQGLTGPPGRTVSIAFEYDGASVVDYVDAKADPGRYQPLRDWSLPTPKDPNGVPYDEVWILPMVAGPEGPEGPVGPEGPQGRDVDIPNPQKGYIITNRDGSLSAEWVDPADIQWVRNDATHPLKDGDVPVYDVAAGFSQNYWVGKTPTLAGDLSGDAFLRDVIPNSSLKNGDIVKYDTLSSLFIIDSQSLVEHSDVVLGKPLNKGETLTWAVDPDGTHGRWENQMSGVSTKYVDDAVSAAVLGLSHGVSVKSYRSTPPTSPAEGDVYIIKPGDTTNPVTGDWVGHENALAVWHVVGAKGSWTFDPATSATKPKEGQSHLVEDTYMLMAWSDNSDGKGTGAWVKAALASTSGGGSYGVGEIAMFPKSAGLPSSYLVCDGSTFDITTYKELYEFLGNSNVLPDLRGKFVRGWTSTRLPLTAEAQATAKPTTGLARGSVIAEEDAARNPSVTIAGEAGHTHGFHTNDDGNHNHSITIDQQGSHVHVQLLGAHDGNTNFTSWGRASAAPNPIKWYAPGGNMEAAGDHSHTATAGHPGHHSHAGTTNAGASHTHTATVGNHWHNVDFRADWDDETRPANIAVVYAIRAFPIASGAVGRQGVQGPKGDKGDKGDTGPIGKGLQINTTVKDKTVLPSPPQANPMDMILTLDTKHLWIYDPTNPKAETTTGPGKATIGWADLGALGSEVISGGTMVGAIAYFPATAMPKGWLMCNGQQFSAADYPELAKYFKDAGIHPVDRTPDLRGQFVRVLSAGHIPLEMVQFSTAIPKTLFTFTNTLAATAEAAGNHNHSTNTSAGGDHTHNTDRPGNHSHAATVDSQGAHTHGYNHVNLHDHNWKGGGGWSADATAIGPYANTTTSAGGHTHNITVPDNGNHTHTALSSGNHSHTITAEAAHTHTITGTVTTVMGGGDTETAPQHIYLVAAICGKDSGLMGEAGPPGPAGPPGQTLVAKGVVATVADLKKIASPVAMDAHLVQDTGDLWVYEPNVTPASTVAPGWVNMGHIQGPKGDQGVGLPTGGLPGQIVSKTATSTAWIDNDPLPKGTTQGDSLVWNATTNKWEVGAPAGKWQEEQTEYRGVGAFAPANINNKANNYGMPAGTLPDPKVEKPKAGDLYINTGAPAEIVYFSETNTGLSYYTETREIGATAKLPQVLGTKDGKKWEAIDSPQVLTIADVKAEIDKSVSGLTHGLAVIDITNNPPATQTLEDLYIVGSSPIGAWLGQANQLAHWDGAKWVFTAPVKGETHLNDNGNENWTWNGTAWVKVSNGIVAKVGAGSMIGAVAFFPVTSLPNGWLECNGQTFSATTYPELAKLFSSLTVPDLRGQFIRAKNVSQTALTKVAGSTAKPTVGLSTGSVFASAGVHSQHGHTAAVTDSQGGHRHIEGGTHWHLSDMPWGGVNATDGVSGPLPHESGWRHPYTGSAGEHTHSITVTAGGDHWHDVEFRAAWDSETAPQHILMVAAICAMDMGTEGQRGQTGPQGTPGLNGQKGDKGDKGDAGETLKVSGAVINKAGLPATPSPLTVLITQDDSHLWIYDPTSSAASAVVPIGWVDMGKVQGPAGPQGIAGATGTITISKVKHLASGATPTVVNTGTPDAAVLEIGIPEGQTGPPGPAGPAGTAATITIGTVATLALPSDPATVRNSGTASAAILDFELPKGDKGDTGAAGRDGDDGYTVWKKAQLALTPPATNVALSDYMDAIRGPKGDDGTSITIWRGTQAAFDALGTQSATTLYLIEKP